MERFFFIILVCYWGILLSGCQSTPSHAPVDNAWQEQKYAANYKVREGDTLYAIAWLYERDYRDLAAINHLPYPYPLKVGQIVHINGQNSSYYQIERPIQVNKISNNLGIKTQKILSNDNKRGNIHWLWPTKGNVMNRFSLAKGNKGVDIAGINGQPVLAARSGKIAYSGNGLKGYGHLIIIKHDDEYLSAYAYNRKLLVQEGNFVKAGQKIAEMGNDRVRKGVLHFEIRKAGQPIDPMRLIAQR